MSIDIPLSLKYRPKKLSQVIGQPVIVKAFNNGFKNKTLHHAYILAGNYGCGKCITGDSLVLMKNGLEKIQNVVPNNKKISKFKRELICESGIGETIGGYFEKDASVLKITTNEGYSIEGTPEHPIKVMGQSGNIVWKRLKDITLEDYACIYRNVIKDVNNKIDIDFNFDVESYYDEKFGNNSVVKCEICGDFYGNLSTHIQLHGISNKEYKEKFPISKLCSQQSLKKNATKNINKNIIIPKETDVRLARLLGYLVAEGHYRKDGFEFSNADKKLIDDFVNLTNDIFGYEPRVKKDKRNNVMAVCLHHLIVRKFIEDVLGIAKSCGKFVPDIILKSSKNIVKEFLRAYFEGDGYSTYGLIGCCSKSYILLQQIQILLLRFGIISSLKKKYTKKLSYVNKDYTSWRLSIYSNNMKKFKENIGFISERKNREMNAICCHKKINPNKDIVPFLQDKLYSFYENLPIKKNGHIVINNKKIGVNPRYPENCKPYSCYHKCLTYRNIKDIINYFDSFINIIHANEDKISDKKYLTNLIDSVVDIRECCKKIYDKNYFYSKIVKIEHGKTSVYDVCKKGKDKSFIANGFINHNTSVSRIIAAMDNCEKTSSVDPCGKCRNCKSIFEGTSFDVREVDAASNRGIDDIRAIHKDLYQCPIECRVKYVIFDEAHSLTGYAAEAALKMIEEPPSHVRFILATTDAHKLKDTIHSRCIMWTFNKVSWMEIYTHLCNIAKKEKIECEEIALKTMARMSKGSVRDGLQNLQTVINYVGDEAITDVATREALGTVDDKLYFDLVQAIVDTDPSKCYQISTEIFKSGKETGVIVKDLHSYLNNLMKAKLCKGDLSSFSLSEDEVKRYTYQAKRIKGSLILELMNLMSKVNYNIIYNLNPQDSFEQIITEAIKAKSEIEKRSKKVAN